MKSKCIQTNLIDSIESQVHSKKLIDSNKTYWIEWKPIAFTQSFLNEIKAKCIQIKLIDSNKTYCIKWKPNAFKQSKVDLIESQVH